MPALSVRFRGGCSSGLMVGIFCTRCMEECSIECHNFECDA